MSNQLDKKLRQIIDAVADDAITDETRIMAIETIKQAVDKYVIGKDEDSRYFTDYTQTEVVQDFETAVEKETRNEMREEQRKILDGNTN